MFLKYISSVLLALFIFMAVVFAVSMSVKCDHPETYEVFAFQSQNSTATSYMKVCCKSCDKDLKTYVFTGTPEDSSYLDVINNGEPVVGGQYYTITANVGNGSYISLENRISCVIERDDVSVNFSVTFKEEYREKIDSLEDGDAITFYGKLSSDGFYWTDCDLITE